MQTALLFPGQGSQEAGMGRDAAEKHADIMDLWKKAEKISGIALREIYWDGDEARMADTRCLQPALTVANYSLWTLLAGKVSPAAAAGHSLGEYSAFAAAGVLPFDKVLELVSLRGRLMAEADPSGTGAMAAILKLTLEQVRECVEAAAAKSGEILVVANYNTPAQYVISGTKAAVEAAQEFIKEAKGRAVPLAVSGAFHSPLMAEAAKEMNKVLESLPKTAWNKAKFPVYCNATAKGETDTDVLKASLSKQMISSVYWVDTLCNQWADGCRRFMECGPKGVLSRMVDPILKDRTGGEQPEVVSIGNAEAAAGA